jgi:hypothetical protein
MRTQVLSFGLLAALAGAIPLLAHDGTPAKADPARIDRLITDLGSAKFAERAKARQELKKIGEPALEALRKAAKADDAETRRGAEELVQLIESKIHTANLLAPKRVKLDLQDVPVPDAIAALAKQSGYAIQIEGDRAELARRKITLKTGEVTFWEAFDQLCQKAALVEAALPPNPYGGNPYEFHTIPIQRLPKIKQAPPGILPVPPPVAPPGFNFQPAPGVQPGKVLPPAAPPPAQVQIQVGVAQAQLVQPYTPPAYGPPTGTNGLAVKSGEPRKLPTCYVGAVRVRALPAPAGLKLAEGQIPVLLEVTAEPRMQQFSLTGSPQIHKAVDVQGQALTVVPNAGGAPAAGAGRAVNPYTGYAGAFPGQRATVLVRLKAGEKPAKALKELAGKLTGQMLTPTEPLLKVENVLKAAGKVAKGEHGGSLEVASVSKEDNGDYKLDVRVVNPPAQNAAGGAGGGRVMVKQIQVQGGGRVFVNGVDVGSRTTTPSLLDKDGKAFRLIAQPQSGLQINGGVVTQSMTLVFRPNPGQGEPASFVINGQRTVTVPIDFRLENVPLP